MCVHVHIYVYVYVYIYMCVRGSMCTCVYVCMCEYVYMCVLVSANPPVNKARDLAETRSLCRILYTVINCTILHIPALLAHFGGEIFYIYEVVSMCTCV